MVSRCPVKNSFVCVMVMALSLLGKTSHPAGSGDNPAVRPGRNNPVNII